MVADNNDKLRYRRMIICTAAHEWQGWNFKTQIVGGQFVWDYYDMPHRWKCISLRDFFKAPMISADKQFHMTMLAKFWLERTAYYQKVSVYWRVKNMSPCLEKSVKNECCVKTQWVYFQGSVVWGHAQDKKSQKIQNL